MNFSIIVGFSGRIFEKGWELVENAFRTLLEYVWIFFFYHLKRDNEISMTRIDLMQFFIEIYKLNIFVNSNV